MKIITHRIPGLVLADHVFDLPLDHDQPNGDQLTVFAREVVAPDKEGSDPVDALLGSAVRQTQDLRTANRRATSVDRKGAGE